MTGGADLALLFATRLARMFAYGFLSVVLVLYLSALGFDGARIGLLLTLTLAGDAVISLWLTTHADTVGRRKVLVTGAGLMLVAAAAFAASDAFPVLLVAATIGVLSPSGNEVGPFLAVEQAALAGIVPDRDRTRVFGWYNLVGSFATAGGALAAGTLVQAVQATGVGSLGGYRAVVVGYGLIGLLMGVLFARLSGRVEAGSPTGTSVRRRLGLHRSRDVVLRLSVLFSLDAFAGGLVMQSVVAYWFHVRFGVEPAALGAIFFGANLLAGLSALFAARLAAHIGLIETMVVTHIPSNVLLILVPFMPTLPLATAVLLLRFSISQMDVPTRQSYTMAVVDPDERSAAAGVTGIARTTGAAVSPSLATPLVADPALAAIPFVAAGALKIVYDLLVLRAFRAVRPPEEGSGTR